MPTCQSIAEYLNRVYTAELTRLQTLARHGDKAAVRQIILTMAQENIAYRAVGYKVDGVGNLTKLDSEVR